MIKGLIAAAVLTSALASVAQAAITAPAAVGVGEQQAGGQEQADRLVVADARSVRHCHNVHRRVYCHKADRLPMNWPPFSDRTGRSTKKHSPAGPKKPSGCVFTRADASRLPA